LKETVIVNIEHLFVFLDASQTLSFSETAERMHISQPTVSKIIHDLEIELGVRLFERKGVRPRLTEAGRALLPWTTKLVKQSNMLKDIARSIKQDVVGSLTIACSTTAGKYILPQLAARFRQQYPQVFVNIPSCTQEDVIPRLLEKDVDLGVVSHEIDNSELESQEFFIDSISLIVPSNHPWTLRSSIEPDELLEEQIIMREPSSGTRRVVLEELAKNDITIDDLNIFLELGNAEAIVRTVAAGYGVAFVSTLAAECPFGRGQIKSVTINRLNLSRTIFMVRKRLDTAHHPQEVFWRFVHEPNNADLLQLPVKI
jgi:LysR family transcriptional regulator, low CO2-responsive transcriptional regulator